MCEGAQLILHCKATITMYLKFVSDTHPVHADDVRPLHQSYQHKICYLQCFKCPTQLLHPCPLQILSAARPPPSSCSPTPQPSPKSRGVEGCVEGWGGWWYLVDNMVREEELRVDGSGKSSPSIICNNANFSTVMNLCEDSDRVGWWSGSKFSTLMHDDLIPTLVWGHQFGQQNAWLSITSLNSVCQTPETIEPELISVQWVAECVVVFVFGRRTNYEVFCLLVGGWGFGTICFWLTKCIMRFCTY